MLHKEFKHTGITAALSREMQAAIPISLGTGAAASAFGSAVLGVVAASVAPVVGLGKVLFDYRVSREKAMTSNSMSFLYAAGGTAK